MSFVNRLFESGGWFWINVFFGLCNLVLFIFTAEPFSFIAFVVCTVAAAINWKVDSQSLNFKKG